MCANKTIVKPSLQIMEANNSTAAHVFVGAQTFHGH
jgi:hypothetical protein